jgi:hypothetical protein
MKLNSKRRPIIFLQNMKNAKNRNMELCIYMYIIRYHLLLERFIIRKIFKQTEGKTNSSIYSMIVFATMELYEQ